MTKDHYIAQTYLRKFTDKENFLHTFYKNRVKDRYQKYLTTKVCYEDDWDILKWTNDANTLKKLLKFIEPYWNTVINCIENSNITNKIIYPIAMYAAILSNLIPVNVKENNEHSAKLLTAYSKTIISNHPDMFASKPAELNLEELYVDVKYDYTKFIGFQSIQTFIDEFLISPWTLLINKKENFITSDCPVCLFSSNFSHFGLSEQYFPLSPKYAVIIHTSPFNKEFFKYRLITPPHMGIQKKEIDQTYVNKFNELMIKCARQFVITNKYSEEMMRKVRRLRKYDSKFEIYKETEGTHTLLLNSRKISE